MNWDAVDFDWNQARAFLVTAREGTLSAAARRLGQTQPTLGRQVAALERHLGVTLFERVGRRLILTDTGRALVEHVQVMGDAAARVALGASGRSLELEGLVRISAGEAIAAYLLPPLIQRIREAHPQIEVQVVASNQLSDLLRREADIAIRHVRPDQPELVARLVRRSVVYLFASREWIARHGRPEVDLAGADLVGPDDVERYMAFLASIGLRVERSQFKWTSASHVVGWEMVRRGLGVGAMVREIAEACPDVERILPEVPVVEVPFWLCTHREIHTNPRIRVTFDGLAEGLAALP